MKNSLKNALNALGLLAFMLLAWATSKDRPITPINMEVKINADSTAFILKNEESIDFVNGRITLRNDSAGVNIFYGLDSFNIKPNAVDTLLFKRFLKFSNKSVVFSKKDKLKEFRFEIFFGGNDGLFTTDF
jgi:hypothetical protein